MTEHFDIIGNYRNKAIANDGEIKVYFSFINDLQKDTNCEICVHFSKNYQNQIYLHEKIIGFANYDYQYDINDETGELEKSSDNKIFHIDLYEDLAKFSAFNMILNKESQLSISLATIENPEEFLGLISELYNDAVKHDENISTNYLEFFHHLENRNYEKLANYFPITKYMLFTFD